MAITWDVQITKVNVTSKRANITFVRTDDATGETETYSFNSAIIGTAAERTALLETVWGSHLETVDKQSAVDAFITNLEQLAKSNLEAREV